LPNTPSASPPSSARAWQNIKRPQSSSPVTASSKLVENSRNLAKTLERLSQQILIRLYMALLRTTPRIDKVVRDPEENIEENENVILPNEVSIEKDDDLDDELVNFSDDEDNVRGKLRFIFTIIFRESHPLTQDKSHYLLTSSSP
jgi:hypothetical protein